MTLQLKRLPVFVALVTLIGVSLTWADDSEIRLRARLAGPPINGLDPSGSAEFRQRQTQRRFSAEVEDVNLPQGTVLNVFVDPASVCTGTLLGTITVGPPPVRGGDLNLDTRNGDSIPRMNAGNIVSVCTAGGRRVLSGSLRRDR